MPRLTNSAPKYRKHRASGQAVVTLSGRDYYLGPHGTKTSKLEYDRLVGEWLANGRHSLHASVGELSIAELAVRYLRFVEARYIKNGRPTSEQPAIRSAIRFVTRLYARQPVGEFGPLALESVRRSMVEQDLALVTINKSVSRIRRMFRWGVAKELVRSETYQSLTALQGLTRGRGEAGETAPIQPVDDSTVDATLPHLQDVVADMVRFQRATGCRPSEVCLLRPCDVDRTGDVWRYIPESHKTEHHGRERVIPIGPRAQEVLLRYLVRDPACRCFSPIDSEAKRRATAHSERRTPLKHGNRPGTNRKRRPKRTAGDFYTADSYRRAVHRACDRAFPTPKDIANDLGASQRWQSDHRWSPNQLRHTAATEIRRQFGLEAAQVVLGHASANITQVYAEKDFELAIRVARQVG